MQHKYVGDVGDFGKYGLLRALAGITTQGEPLSLGIAWYLNGSETGTPGDGKHTSYLTKPEEYRNCDPELFDCMSQIISEAGLNPEIRHLKSVERSGILGSTAVFHGDLSVRQARTDGRDLPPPHSQGLRRTDAGVGCDAEVAPVAGSDA